MRKWDREDAPDLIGIRLGRAFYDIIAKMRATPNEMSDQEIAVFVLREMIVSAVANLDQRLLQHEVDEIVVNAVRIARTRGLGPSVAVDADADYG